MAGGTGRDRDAATVFRWRRSAPPAVVAYRITGR